MTLFSEDNQTVVCIAGLGTVGLPTAIHIANFFNVVGYDIKKDKVENARLKGIGATTLWNEVLEAGIYVIAVSTGIDMHNNADISSVHDVFSKIGRVPRKNDVSPLVCVESTVTPSTCSKLAKKYNVEIVVHCPHRYWPKDPDNHGVVQPRILGALDEKSMNIGKWFYDTLQIPVFPVSSIEVAETSKIAENAYRFVQISFAEELSLICRRLGLSFDEIRNACNSKWNTEILEARGGIGGHCLPKDVRYLSNILKSPLLIGAIETDRGYVISQKKGSKQ